MNRQSNTMTFEEFQNYARLYVLGALEPQEIARFEFAKEQYGPAAQEFVDECNCRRERLELSLKPAKKLEAIKAQLLSMVSRRSPTSSRFFSSVF